MTLASKILDFKFAFAGAVETLMENIATKFFNYPQVPGMPVYQRLDSRTQSIVDYVRKLPVHDTHFPSPPLPKTLSQVFLGNFPPILTIDRTFYEHRSDGFYNFYVPNYKNIFFLPDWLSQWIQLTFDISVDTTPLEIFQQAIFIILIAFYFIIEFRVKLYWFLTINPYTRPWVYLISLTDWIQDAMTGLSPVMLGVDLTAPLILGITGKIADALNHLVFTMPFLPSEGQPGKMLIDKKVQDVILFRYLPSLWYTNPIPDQLREFWYTQRRDIFNFMQKNYGQLDIEFLPNRILKEMYEQQHLTKSLVGDTSNIKDFSTNLISNVSLYSDHILDHFQFIQHQANFIFDIADKFIT